MRYKGHKTAHRPKLFAGMPAEAFNRLMAGSTTVEVQGRQSLLTEGKRPAHLHFLLDGSVELFAKCGERESSISMVEPHCPFILAAVVKNAPYLMSARTLSDSRILLVPAATFRAAMRVDSALSIATSNELSSAFRKVVRELRSHKLRSAKMRLANYLAIAHRKQASPSAFTLATSKKKLASLLGLEPESLSRVFANLEPHGVEVRGDQIIVRDIEALEAVAQFNHDLDDAD